MNKLNALLAGAEIGLLATAVFYLAFGKTWVTYLGVAGVTVALLLITRLLVARPRVADGPSIGVGTVREVGRQVFVEVVAVSGETFVGKLALGDGDRDGDTDLSMLRPGLVVLVAFDPAAREDLSLPDDVLAVHASWAAAS